MLKNTANNPWIAHGVGGRADFESNTIVADPVILVGDIRES